jgi:hypothetical protein
MLEALYPELNLSQVPRIGGIPRFACRQGFEQLLKYVATRRGDALVALIEELRLLQYLGLFVQCWHLRKESLQRAVMAAAFLVVAAVASAQSSVQLTIADGRVSLLTHAATVPQILAEWTRVGGTHIDNVASAAGGALDLQLTYATEEQALQVLLRDVNYILVERAASTQPAIASRIQRILIAPTKESASAPTLAATNPPGLPYLAPAAALSQVQPIIGLDGRPVPDDQTEAPPPTRR